MSKSPKTNDADTIVTPTWQTDLREQTIGISSFWHEVYFVMEASTSYSSVTSRLITAIQSNIRRRFVHISYADIVDRVKGVASHAHDGERTGADSGKKARGRSSGAKHPAHGHNPAPPPAATSGSAEDQLMALAASELMHEGRLQVVTTALLLKQMIHRRVLAAVAQAHAIPVAENQSTDGAPSNNAAAGGHDASSGAKRGGDKKTAQKRSTSVVKNRLGAEGALAESEDVEDGYCSSRAVSLKKRGVPDDPEHRHDEPEHGPDLYIIISGVYDASVVAELSSCRVPVAAVFRLQSRPCLQPPATTTAPASAAVVSIEGATRPPPRRRTADPPTAHTDQSPDTFWQLLDSLRTEQQQQQQQREEGEGESEGSVSPPPPAPLRHTPVVDVTVDMCRIHFAVGDTQANQQVFDQLAPCVYRLVTERRLYDAYTLSLSVTHVPESDRSTRQDPLYSAVPAAGGGQVPGTVSFDSCATQLLIADLVQSVCSLFDRKIGGSEEEDGDVGGGGARVNDARAESSGSVDIDNYLSSPSKTKTTTTARAPVEVSVSSTVTSSHTAVGNTSRLPYQNHHGAGSHNHEKHHDEPCVVYAGDRIGVELYGIADQQARASVEHIIQQTCELHNLQRMPAASRLATVRYNNLIEQLCAEGVLESPEMARLALDSLLFDSLYPVLKADSQSGSAVWQSGGIPRVYPHPYIVQVSVRPDVRRLPPECGLTETAANSPAALQSLQLDSSMEPSATPPALVAFSAVELLDSVTLAQRLQRCWSTGGQPLAAYFFPGTDSLYLIYGHRRVVHGRSADSWTWCGHATVGFGDFHDYVRHWASVSVWLERKELELDRVIEHRSKYQRVTVVKSESIQLTSVLNKRSAPIADDFFVLPGSLKDETRARNVNAGSAADGAVDVGVSIKSGDDDTKTAGSEQNRDVEPNDTTRTSTDSQLSPADQSPSIQTDPQQPYPLVPSDRLLWRSSPVFDMIAEHGKAFFGYDLPSGPLHIGGQRQRQYFSDGSYVTVERTTFIRQSTRVTVSVCHDGCQLTLFPTDGSSDAVVSATLPGGYVMRPDWDRVPVPVVPVVPPAVNDRSAAPVSAAVQPPTTTAGEDRSKSVKSDKNKRKQTNTARASGVKKKSTAAVTPAAGSVKTAAATVSAKSATPQREPPTPSAVFYTYRQRRILRLSCANGLVIELLPDSEWSRCSRSDYQPSVRVRQYFVASGMERVGVRLFMSDGTLVRLEDSRCYRHQHIVSVQAPTQTHSRQSRANAGSAGGIASVTEVEQVVSVIYMDGSYTECLWCEQQSRLITIRHVTASGYETRFLPSTDYLTRENSSNNNMDSPSVDGVDYSDKLTAQSRSAVSGSRVTAGTSSARSAGSRVGGGSVRRGQQQKQQEQQALTAGSQRLSAVECRRYLMKLSTDPVSDQLYVEREDGVRAVLDCDGRCLTEHCDGTRVSLSFCAENKPHEPNDESPQVDQQVAAGFDHADVSSFIHVTSSSAHSSSSSAPNSGSHASSALSLTPDNYVWLLGVRFVDLNRVEDRPTVTLSHERYARVLVHRWNGACEVHVPGGVRIISDPGGISRWRVSVDESAVLQLSEGALSFTATTKAAPVVHTLQLTSSTSTAASSYSNTVHTTSCGLDSETNSKLDRQQKPSSAAAANDQIPQRNTGGTAMSVDSPVVTCDGVPVPAGTRANDGTVPPSVSTLCESVDYADGGVVYRVGVDGFMDCGGCGSSAGGCPLEEQLDEEELAITPLPLSLFVIQRDGSGRQLLTIDDVDDYCRRVRQSDLQLLSHRTPPPSSAETGGLVSRHQHPASPSLSVVRCFHSLPDHQLPLDRWLSPVGASLLPVHLRSYNLHQLAQVGPELGPDSAPQLTTRPRDIFWQSIGEDAGRAMLRRSPLYYLCDPDSAAAPSSVFLYRQMVVAAPLSGSRRSALLRWLHQAEGAHQGSGASGGTDEVLQLEDRSAPVHSELQHIVHGNWLTVLESTWPSEDAPGYNSGIKSAGGGRKTTSINVGGTKKSETSPLLDRQLIADYRQQLRLRRFLPYFQAGSDPHQLFTSAGIVGATSRVATTAPAVKDMLLRCEAVPCRLEFGLVPATATVTRQFKLVATLTKTAAAAAAISSANRDGSESAVDFVIARPAVGSGLRVVPTTGKLLTHISTDGVQLTADISVQLTPEQRRIGADVSCRGSVFYRLMVRLISGGGVRQHRLTVPVLACVAQGRSRTTGGSPYRTTVATNLAF